MVAVNVADGVKYGFRLLGYLLAVFIAGGILLVIAGSVAPGPFDQGNPILMVIFGIAGVAVIYAGSLGLMYKVIADGVERGNLSADQGGDLGNTGGAVTGSGGGRGPNRQPAQRARDGGQRSQRTGGQARQGGQQAQQGGRQAPQGGRGGGHEQAGEQQPPGDWEPGN